MLPPLPIVTIRPFMLASLPLNRKGDLVLQRNHLEPGIIHDLLIKAMNIRWIHEHMSISIVGVKLVLNAESQELATHPLASPPPSGGSRSLLPCSAYVDRDHLLQIEVGPLEYIRVARGVRERCQNTHVIGI